MIRVRSRMIRAGPDGPGGGPDDPETRLVEAQGRMSGWRSGRPGRVRMIRDGVRMIRLQVGASGVFGTVTRMIRRGTRMIRLGPDDPDGGPDVRASFSRSSVFFSFLPSSLPCLALIL